MTSFFQRRIPPSQVARGFALVVAVLSLFAYGWSQMDLLGDTFWYIATGRYVLEHRAFPLDELFSYAAVRGPWFVNMPLSEPLFAWIADHLGVRALLAICTAVFGTALTLFWLPHAKGTVARLLTWPLVVFAIYVERGDLSARSQTIAYLFIAVLFLCMFRLRDGKAVTRWLPLLLGAVWINVHPSWLVGVLVPVGFAVALRVSPREGRPTPTQFLLFSALLALGGFINPYGHRLVLEILRFMTAESTTAIDLFRSPDFRSPEIVIALFLAVATMFGCLVSASRQTPEALIMLAMIAMTCVSRRYVNILMAYEIVLAGRLLQSMAWTRTEPSVRWLVLASSLPVGLAAFSLQEPKEPWQHMPVEAAQFIEENKLPDNVMNMLHWGGYLDYAWRGRRRIFIDGRTTQFENGVLTDYVTLYNAGAGSRDLLDVYIVNTVLGEGGSPLDVALSRDPDWRLAFRKGIAVVYVRRQLVH